MSAPDLFALGGRKEGDQFVLCLFRLWIEAARDFERAPEDQVEAADARWAEIEDEIVTTSGGAIALAVKGFVLLRRDFNGIYAPLPYLRSDPDCPPSALDISFLRDAAALVPEIAELASPIIHADTVLIDADIEVDWAKRVLADDEVQPIWAGRNKWRQWVNDKQSEALDRIANTEARTERGVEIKARNQEHEEPDLVSRRFLG
jgi:hypothetical protein